MARDFQLPGRSAAVATEAMAATSHPLATAAALEVLRAGGNAADAAVTALAVLCVVEPHMTGIGGDCYCLLAKPDEPLWGYNGSGRAAAAASTEALLQQGIRSIAGQSIHAVTVPGAVDAWAAILKRHGGFGLNRALAPAIRYAEHGFPVAARVAWDWQRFVAMLAADPGAAKHYLVNGSAPGEGDVIKMPALAETLKAIAARGPRAFYEGAIADDMVATIRARGSLLTVDDFANHRGDEVTPISTAYRGLDLAELPPNGQGIVALVLLNILENFDLGALDPLGAERIHLMTEAARMAYAVRDTHVTDADHMRVNVPDLIDKRFAKQLAAKIDRTRRVPLLNAPTPGSDTVYLTVVDRDRMAVSLINSLYGYFGVGIATERTGILLTNRGSCFVVDPDHPNTFAAGKRPLHTIIPAMSLCGGRCDIAFGVMGAHYQPMGHSQFVTNTVDYGMDVQAAIDGPRVFFEGDTTIVERGVPPPAIARLREMGHTVEMAPFPWGGAQAVRIDWDRGVLIGGSDPRKDGSALGY